ncbi:hypothetical protein SAMN05660443_0370 [Marinospirillum celere]|uniref:Chromosome partition protein Smc n=2 Tax=Marinospirillum celere TaxID=1122252 RepID=A0A1I1E5H5_9GAMM|nr:hypothetical protein SAMN05660443_0370 [Marinospirillum celere]
MPEEKSASPRTPKTETTSSTSASASQTQPQRQASEAARAEVRKRLAEKEVERKPTRAEVPPTRATREKEEASYRERPTREQPADSSSTSREFQQTTASGYPNGGGGGGNGSGNYPTLPPDGGKSFSTLALVALVLAVLGLGFGGWQLMRAENQQQAMEALADRIQELEIRLSETGQDLTEAGSSFSQRLRAHQEKLEWADDEIRKLWVVAHQRNRPAIAELQEKLEKVEGDLASTRTSANQANQNAQQAAERLERATNRWNEQLRGLSSEVESYSNRLAEISLTTSTLNQQVRDQDRRQQVEALNQEVRELRGQITQLTQQASAEVPEDLGERLAEYEEILASLEASRSQLTSRVTRLMDDVRELQQGR